VKDGCQRVGDCIVHTFPGFFEGEIRCVVVTLTIASGFRQEVERVAVAGVAILDKGKKKRDWLV